jgi:uncharacterized protein YggE
MKNLIAMWVVMSPFLAMAEEKSPRSVTVIGMCQKKVHQDRGVVSFAIEHIERTSKQASDLTAQQLRALSTKVKAMNLNDLTLDTSGYTVLPDYEWTKGKQIFKGYKARATLDVDTSQTEKLGDIVAAGLALEVKNVERVAAYISPKKMRAEQSSCLETATKDAQQNAERIAKAVDAKLGAALSISQEGTRSSQPARTQHYAMAKSMESDSAESPNIEMKPEDLSVSVSASFELK